MNTIEEMIDNKMIYFKKNGKIDKRCSAYKRKIVNENCEIVLQKIEDIVNTESSIIVNEQHSKVDTVNDSLQNLLLSETAVLFNDKMMDDTIGWLLDAQSRFIFKYSILPDQKREILEMTFKMIRDFLQRNKISNNRLQLIAIVAWRIANKLLDDEFYVTTEQLIHICDYDYTTSDMCNFEFKLINYISYSVCNEGITSHDFMKKYQGGIMQCFVMTKKDILKQIQ
jgi:hypothetical protein